MLFHAALLILGAPAKNVVKQDGGQMSCSVYGDPHVKSFTSGGERACNLWGTGVFPLVALPGVKASAFFCPPPLLPNKVKASWISAIAVKVGEDVVTLLGDTVKVNGEKLDLTQGDATKSLNGMEIHGKFEAAKSATRVLIASGDYDMNFFSVKEAENNHHGWIENWRISAPNQTVDGYCANACAAAPGSVIQSASRQNMPQMFSDSDLTALMAGCNGATVTDDYVICEEKPDACNVCTAKGISCDTAIGKCKAGCPCADEEELRDCTFDYCMMDEDEAIITTCAENAGCSA